MTIFLMLARSNICCLQTKHDDQKWSTAAKQKLELFSFCNSRFSVVLKKKKKKRSWTIIPAFIEKKKKITVVYIIIVHQGSDRQRLEII